MGNTFPGKQVLPRGEGIGYLGWSSRIVEQLMDRVAIAQCPTPHDRRKVESLLLSPETSAFDAFLHDLLRERIAGHEADIGELAFAIVVANDSRVLAPDGMVVARDGRACGRCQQFHPPACRVVSSADVVRTIFKPDGVGDGELVVVNAGGLCNEAGLRGRADLHMLVGEPALEGVEQMASRLSEGVQTFDLCIGSRVERGHEDELV